MSELFSSVYAFIPFSYGFKIFDDVIANGGVCKGVVFNSLEISRKKVDEYTELVKGLGTKALAYLKKDKGAFAGSLNNALSDDIKNKLNLKDGDIIFIIADKVKTANAALCALRLKVANDFVKFQEKLSVIQLN